MVSWVALQSLGRKNSSSPIDVATAEGGTRRGGLLPPARSEFVEILSFF